MFIIDANFLFYFRYLSCLNMVLYYVPGVIGPLHLDQIALHPARITKHPFLINLFIMSCMIAIILLWVYIIFSKIMGEGMIINHTRVFTFKIYFKLKKVSLEITHILLEDIMLMGVIMIGGVRLLGEVRELGKIEENAMR